MSDDQMFEREAQAWLELGPSRAPARAVQNALRIIDTTSQQRDLRILWRFPHVTMNKRFAVAAAIGLLIVGAGLLILRSPQSQVGGPSPSPTASPGSSPISLDELLGTWASVGTRSDPIGDHANPPQRESMAVDAAGLRINSFKGDIYSSLSITGPAGTFAMQMSAAQDMLTRQSWDCTTGDNGTYYATLSSDKQTLTLRSAGDACATRADILTGDWTRWLCPNASQYAYCDHVSELTPGKHVSPVFMPYGGGTTGHLSYTVPAGWADLTQPPTWPGRDSAQYLGLTTLDATDRPAIEVFSNLRPSRFARAVLNTGKLDGLCTGNTPATDESASAIADWLETLPNLAVSGRTRTLIGGLGGVQIDVSTVPGYVDPCHGESADNGPMVPSTEIEIFGFDDGTQGIWMDSATSDRARFIALDTGNVPLMIVVTASSQSAIDALIAKAMPVITSFEFIP